MPGLEIVPGGGVREGARGSHTHTVPALLALPREQRSSVYVAVHREEQRLPCGLSN